jgi:hypothetical protein
MVSSDKSSDSAALSLPQQMCGAVPVNIVAGTEPAPDCPIGHERAQGSASAAENGTKPELPLPEREEGRCPQPLRRSQSTVAIRSLIARANQYR